MERRDRDTQGVVESLERVTPFSGTFTDAVDEFGRLFGSAVKRHMIADVKVGAFLSGGLDSSLIVRHACEFTDEPLVSFTTGFRAVDTHPGHCGKNELVFARQLKNLLGPRIDYRELILEPNLLELLPSVIWHLDEPITDPAEINAYLICREARRGGITVLLSNGKR